MADFKEINAEKFKENLVSNFGDNDKVNIFFEELVQKNTDKNPFFYSVILNHIEKNNLSITDLVDSKSQVHFEQINVAIAQAHKEYKEKIVARENSEKQNNQNQLINEEINKDNQEFEERFKLIDFSNLKEDDIICILQNFPEASKKMTDEEYKITKEELANLGKNHNMSEELINRTVDIMDIQRALSGEKRELPKELYTKKNVEYLLKRGAQLNEQGELVITEDVMRNVNDDRANLATLWKLVKDIGIDQVNVWIEEGLYPEYQELLKTINMEVSDLQNKDKEFDEISLEVENKSITDEYLNYQTEEVIEVFREKPNSGINNRSQDFQMNNANEWAFSYFTTEEEIEQELIAEQKKAQMQAENEQYIDAKMTVTKDYAEMGLEGSKINLDAAEAFWGDEFGDEEFEDIGQDVVELESKTQQVKPIEPEVKAQEFLDLDPINLEDVEQKVQEEIDNSDYQQEIDEKTGIAGLFAAIANSRVGRAVKNLFKTKDAQQRLNAPVTQRTEDGLKITEYESNGSLMPTTIQARNFLRDFAVNTVEAVTNFANNISDAIRGSKKDEIINKPTIIKSEPIQEQTEKVEQKQVIEQVQEQTETFNDTNKWAVSNESRQRRQAEIDAQRKVTQSVTKQLETQEQNNSDKSGPMIGE